MSGREVLSEGLFNPTRETDSDRGGRVNVKWSLAGQFYMNVDIVGDGSLKPLCHRLPVLLRISDGNEVAFGIVLKGGEVSQRVGDAGDFVERSIKDSLFRLGCVVGGID